MTEFSYRLSPDQKTEIARNLIGVMEHGEPVHDKTACFVGNWILTSGEEKRKAFFDVWDIVLKRYCPTTRPILFRSCSRPVDGRISSFTGSLACAARMRHGRGLLLACDTAPALEYDRQFRAPGNYRHTFYSVAELLRIARDSGNPIVSDSYLGEDEHIMRVDTGNMRVFKWHEPRKKVSRT